MLTGTRRGVRVVNVPDSESGVRSNAPGFESSLSAYVRRSALARRRTLLRTSSDHGPLHADYGGRDQLQTAEAL